MVRPWEWEVLDCFKNRAKCKESVEKGGQRGSQRLDRSCGPLKWFLSSQEVHRPHLKNSWLSSLHGFPFALRPSKPKGMKKRQMTEVFSLDY